MTDLERYTRYMEGGERRTFRQNREDDKLILAALKERIDREGNE